MKRVTAAFCAAAMVLSAASASDLWRMGEPEMIYSGGTMPSLWNGQAAFHACSGGPVMFYDGTDTPMIHEPTASDWEAKIANGGVAWRHTVSGVGSNDIMLWDGESIRNISNSPGVLDSDLASGGNGDLIWCQAHTGLLYYDASEDEVIDLGICGVHPSLYITDDGVATYAYQDPDTDEVYFFDGAETHLLGAGNVNGASPSAWDGAVAWVGQGEVGNDFTKGEIYYWKNGVTTRVTNDDEGGSGIMDEYPTLWYDSIVWCRGINGMFSPKLFIWDHYSTSQLTFETSKYPSFHNGQLAWSGSDGLYVADMIRRGDFDMDHDIDVSDLAQLLARFGDTDVEYADGDVNEDGVVNTSDLATLLVLYGYGF